MGDMSDMAVVKGAGGDGRVTEEELQGFFDAVSDINRDSEKYWALRLNAEATRYQTWDGQSPDGKQRAEYMGSQPFPFDGASDQRVYWADTLVNERVRLFMVAARRAVVNCVPSGKGKAEAAWKSTQALRWFVRQMRQRWWRELRRAANYGAADSPAVCVMKVSWERTREVELRRLTAGELAGLYVRLATEGGTGAAGEITAAAQEFEAALANGDADETTLRDLIMDYFDVKAGRAEKAVRELREEGAAEFPVPGEWREGLRVRALRYADDFYMPDATSDWEDCPAWFECEWLDKATLLERAEREDWDGAFTEAVLELPGEAGFKEYEAAGTVIREARKELHDKYYHLITAHYRAVSEDGVAARYRCLFHTGVAGKTAYGRKLERDAAAVFYSGEVLDGWLLNSRGIPERIGPAAGVRKGLQDDMCDGARLKLLPPVAGDGYGTGKDETLPLEPLGYIPLKRGGRITPVSLGAYPAETVAVLKGMKDDRDEQFSRPVDGVVPKQVSDTATEDEVLSWLDFVQEVYAAAMRLVALHATDATLARISDPSGRPLLPDGRNELADEYDVEVIFDATTLDEDRLIKKAQAIAAVKQSDGESVLNMTPLVKAITRGLFPHHADDALQLGNDGQQGEWENERDNYLALRAGVTPRMVDDGTWNYDMRLQFYVELLEGNPQALDDLGQDKRAGIENWIKFLQQQATQYGENRETGRTGVKSER